MQYLWRLCFISALKLQFDTRNSDGFEGVPNSVTLNLFLLFNCFWNETIMKKNIGKWKVQQYNVSSYGQKGITVLAKVNSKHISSDVAEPVTTPLCLLALSPAWRTCAHHSEMGTIWSSGWFPTMWSIKFRPTGGLHKQKERSLYWFVCNFIKTVFFLLNSRCNEVIYWIKIKENLCICYILLTVLLTEDPGTEALCSLAGKGLCKGRGTQWVCVSCPHTEKKKKKYINIIMHSFPLWCVSCCTSSILTYRLNDGILDLSVAVLLHPGLPDNYTSMLLRCLKVENC